MVQTRQSSQLWIFLFAQMVFFLDFQTMPLFFSTFSETFDIDYAYMGFLISLYSICLISSPIFGNLSDQYGRRGFLILGLVIFAIYSLIMVGAQDWMHIVIAKTLSGIAGAIFLPVLLAHLGDEYSYEERTRAMGFVRLAWPISFIFGVPLVGYSIEHLNWRLPFVMMTIVTLIAGLAIYQVNFSNDEAKKRNLTVKQSRDLFKGVLEDQNAVSALMMMVLAVGAMQGMFVFFPAWMETEFQLGESSISIIYSFMGIGTLIGTLLATWIGDDFGAKECATIGLVTAAGFMILLTHFSFHPIFVIIWLLFLGMSFDFAVTVRPVLFTQLVPEAKGTIISLNRALSSGAAAVTAALSGLIWTYYGYMMIGVVFASITFIGALIGIFRIQIGAETADFS
ncbi:MAG: MFS transporter [Candidatus Hodarchaeota archaeon]